MIPGPYVFIKVKITYTKNIEETENFVKTLIKDCRTKYRINVGI